MADFETALKIVLNHEGGFVNNPLDPGGATNYGISSRTLASYSHQPVSLDQIKGMTLEEAAQIYRNLFWDDLHLGEIENQVLANIVFDLSVLLGPSLIIRTIQENLNIPADSILGSQTLLAINKYIDSGWLSLKILLEVQKKMVDICSKIPAQSPFLAGWINRTHDLLELLYNTNTNKKGK